MAPLFAAAEITAIIASAKKLGDAGALYTIAESGGADPAPPAPRRSPFMGGVHLSAATVLLGMALAPALLTPCAVADSTASATNSPMRVSRVFFIL